VPTSSNAVTIAVAPASGSSGYTITLQAAEAPASVLLEQAAATLEVYGGTLTAPLTLKAGTFEIYEGTYAGTLSAAGGSVTAYDGTLSGVTTIGSLSLSPYYGGNLTATVEGGLTIANTGSTVGTLNINGSYLLFSGNQTVNGGVLSYGSGAYATLALEAGGTPQAATTLTLGSKLTLLGQGSATLGYSYDTTDTIINDGTINQTAGTLTIGAGVFDNAATLSVASGAAVVVGSHSFTNTGAITLATGELLEVTNGTATSTGKLTVQGGTLAVASSGALTAPVTLQSGDLELYQGTYGGTLTATGGSITAYYGTLSAVTLVGSLALVPYYNGNLAATVEGGLTLAKSGSTVSTLNIGDSYLEFAGNQTVNGGVLALGSTGFAEVLLEAAGSPLAASTLTLGSSLTLLGQGSAELGASTDTTDTIINDGTISQTAGTLSIGGGAFTNAGTVTVASGALLELTSGSLASTGKILVEGGTLALGGSNVTLGELKLATFSAGGVAELVGTLSNTGSTLTLGGAGATPLVLAPGGDIVGGTVVPGGDLQFAGGTLSSVTYSGLLDLSAPSANLTLLNGFGFTGGTGTIGLTGANADLTLGIGQTLTGVTLDGGAPSSNDTLTIGQYYVGSPGTVTLAASDSLLVGTAQLYIDGAYSNGTNTLLNNGTISLTTGGALTVQGLNFDNAGVVSVQGALAPATLEIFGNGLTNSGTVVVGGPGSYLSTSLTNAGLVTVENGASASLYNYTSTGTLLVDAGSTASLTGSLATTSLGKIVVAAGASLAIDATLNNAGGTLAIGAGTALGTLSGTGTLSGGVIKDSGNGLGQFDGTLSGVTYEGALDLGAVSTVQNQGEQFIEIANGIVLTGSTGSGAGSIVLGGASAAELNVLGATTLANLGIGTTGTFSEGLTGGYAGGSQILSLASSVHIAVASTSFTLGGNSYYEGGNSDIANAGTLTDTTAGGTLVLQGNLANSGVISVSGGAVLDLDTSVFANTGSVKLAGGALDLTGTLATAQLNSIALSGGATVSLTGLLNNAGATLTIGKGTVLGTLAGSGGGTIAGGTVLDKGDGLSLFDGTLDNVTYAGVLAIGANAGLANYQSIEVLGTLTLTGATGSGVGSITMGGATAGYLTFGSGVQVLDNVNISTTGSYTQTISGGNAFSNAALILGAHASIKVGGTNFDLGNSSGAFISEAGSLTDAVAGSSVQLLGTLANSGTIALSNGASLIDDLSSLNNTGLISLSGGTFALGGTVSTAQLAAIKLSNGAVVDVASGGVINNTGATLTIGAGTSLGTLIGNGAILGGTVSDKGNGLGLFDGVLNSVTYEGTLDIGGTAGIAGQQTIFADGTFALTGATGTGAGALVLGGAESGTLDFASGTQALNNANISAVGSFTTALAGGYAFNAVPSVLSLGSAVNITVTGTQFDLGNYYSNDIAFAGKLTDAVAGSEVVLVGTLANAGAIAISNGATLYDDLGSLTNTGTISLAGGTFALAGFITTATLDSVKLSGGAVVDVLESGQISNTGTTLAIGTATSLGTLQGYGTIAGGIIKDAGGGLNQFSGTLNGVTYDGKLTVGAVAQLSGAQIQQINVSNGITLTGAAGTGAGAVTLGGAAGGELNFVGAQTLANVAITAAGAVGDELTGGNVLANDVLAIQSTVAVNVTGSLLVVGTDTNFVSDIANAGHITDATAGSTVVLTGAFANSGTVAVSNGATLALDPYALTNTGKITVANAVVAVQYATLADLEELSVAASALAVTGTLDLGQGTLSSAAGGQFASIHIGNNEANLYFGTVQNGTLVDATGALQFGGYAELYNVTYDGTLDLARPVSEIYVVGGTFAGASGTGTAAINLTGAGSLIDIGSGTTLNNATLNIGNIAETYAGQAIGAPSLSGDNLMLGSALSVVQAATYANVQGFFGETTTNLGNITGAIAGGTLSFGGGVFSNAGTIAISNGDTLSMTSAQLINTGLISLAGTATTLSLQLLNYYASNTLAPAILTNNGTLALSGATISEITQGGSVPPVAIENAGAGVIDGFGTLSVTLINDSNVLATGGTLALQGAVVGIGTLEVGAKADLVVGSVAAHETALFTSTTGMLSLSPISFLGEIGGFVSGDLIDLVGIAAKSAEFGAHSIVVTLSSGGTETLNLTSTLTGALSVSSDGHGGSVIGFAGAAAHADHLGCVFGH
jgi:hypothetical protein